MARKRNRPPNSTPSQQPPLKLHHHDSEQECQEQVEEEVSQEDADVAQDINHTANVSSTSSIPAEEDDDSIKKLLEHLGKDELATLLCEVASNHRDVADQIRKAANSDPSHRKVFVHGLGWDTIAETLTAAFRQYGEIEDCKAVTDNVTGKSNGYGFILFKTCCGARKALEQPQKKIGNRVISCQLASLGPVQQQPDNFAQPNYNNLAAPNNSAAFAVPVVSEYTQRKIYVSNVGRELDPQRLLLFFSKFGEIEEGPLGLNKVTRKPKGFCLFVYKRAESAKRALEEPHKAFEGRVLHCRQAIDCPKSRKPQKQQPQRKGMKAAAATVMQFQRSGGNSGFVTAGDMPGHLMAPAGPAVGFNQGAAVLPAQTLESALGQAYTALLASQGAGLGLNGLFGTLGSQATVNPGVPAVGHGMQVGYNNQAHVNPGAIGVYGNQVGFPGAYPNQQVGLGSGRGQQQQQYNVGQFGGVVPYTGP